ncbi:MAG: hypothetical protein IJ689_07570 [Alphaproteobacteria bacterium]|nr:hypothetical protein [Alphaproteobacteria bacterium]
MTTNKTFLILLLAGVSYTAYNAVAVSENFEISTTIDHEIVLGGFKSTSTDDADLHSTGDINLGTITVNLVYNNGQEMSGCIVYNPDGSVSSVDGDIISATSAALGTFTANIPNPSACDQVPHCGGLTLYSRGPVTGIFSNIDSYPDNCEFLMTYTGGNGFKVFPDNCCLNGVPASSINSGTHTKNLTISYTAN